MALIGNLHQLNAPKLHRVLQQWAQEPGAPYRFQRAPEWLKDELAECGLRVCRDPHRRFLDKSRISQIESDQIGSIDRKRPSPEPVVASSAA
ncbi:hypothetical protein [Paraburkholderia heleia]|uniref:hypothetical protein n=1 Tax=Paraburkholderia heleia TaxID=634127 RepID=UPI0012EDC377|nr:hypothetical protein [Paraburkholderia heleia]